MDFKTTNKSSTTHCSELSYASNYQTVIWNFQSGEGIRNNFQRFEKWSTPQNLSWHFIILTNKFLYFKYDTSTKVYEDIGQQEK